MEWHGFEQDDLPTYELVPFHALRFKIMIKNRPPLKEAEIGLVVKISQAAKAAVIGSPDDDVIENFNFQKLTGSDEVAGDFDVCLGWSRVAARMIVANDDCCCTCHD